MGTALGTDLATKRDQLLAATQGLSAPLELSAFLVRGEPVAFAEASRGQYAPFHVGESWGPPWSTTWFHIRGRVPSEWSGQNVVAVFDIGFECRRTPRRRPPLRDPGGAGSLCEERRRRRVGGRPFTSEHFATRDHRRRPRPHRHGVAVAAARNPPEVRAHVLDRARAHGRIPRLPLRVLAAGPVRVDERVLPGRLPANTPEGDRRPVGTGRLDVGRGGLQPAVGRGAGPPVLAGQALLHAGVRGRHARAVAA